MTDIPFPYVSKELLERLSSVFRDRCPSLEMTDREVWIAVGAQAVIRKLRSEHEAQAQRQLETK